MGLLEHVGEVEPECELVWVWGLQLYMYVSCDCSRGDRGRLSQFLYLILPHDFETAN